MKQCVVTTFSALMSFCTFTCQAGMQPFLGAKNANSYLELLAPDTVLKVLRNRVFEGLGLRV